METPPLGGFGARFWLYCVGPSTALMLILSALSLMNIGWMLVITALVVAQKLLPGRGAVDVPLALAIVGLGVLIIIAPCCGSPTRATDVNVIGVACQPGSLNN